MTSSLIRRQFIQGVGNPPPSPYAKLRMVVVPCRYKHQNLSKSSCRSRRLVQRTINLGALRALSQRSECDIYGLIERFDFARLRATDFTKDSVKASNDPPRKMSQTALKSRNLGKKRWMEIHPATITSLAFLADFCNWGNQTVKRPQGWQTHSATSPKNVIIRTDPVVCVAQCCFNVFVTRCSEIRSSIGNKSASKMAAPARSRVCFRWQA